MMRGAVDGFERHWRKGGMSPSSPICCAVICHNEMLTDFKQLPPPPFPVLHRLQLPSRLPATSGQIAWNPPKKSRYRAGASYGPA